MPPAPARPAANLARTVVRHAATLGRSPATPKARPARPPTTPLPPARAAARHLAAPGAAWSPAPRSPAPGVVALSLG